MKKDLLLQMLEVTKLQQTALESEDIDQFQSLMQTKQVIIDQIDQLTNAVPRVLEEADREILLEIAKIDQQNQKEFNMQLDEVKLQLRKIRQLKKRDTMYSNPYGMSQEEGLFIDKK
ncbi:hypothetical protein [Cellulosilyticum sp. I15G10I2]|uniref:hypothetical protein n=1 Tax=Cellulosilyticum sp. I15G10I2 TaxID=1892843 RepID=UPI00085BD20E|nr:hypothetical protein [Cellulosilyticum sp. I15G10I2]